MSGRCTGHCCKAFYFPYAPEQVEEMLVWLLAVSDGLDPGHPPYTLPEDSETILPMLVPIVKVMPGDQHPGDPLGVIDFEGWMYTCVHFDDSTGNCRIYDRRPRMCSGYPYGRDCQHSGCTAPCRGNLKTKGVANAGDAVDRSTGVPQEDQPGLHDQSDGPGAPGAQG